MTHQQRGPERRDLSLRPIDQAGQAAAVGRWLVPRSGTDRRGSGDKKEVAPIDLVLDAYTWGYHQAIENGQRRRHPATWDERQAAAMQAWENDADFFKPHYLRINDPGRNDASRRVVLEALGRLDEFVHDEVEAPDRLVARAIEDLATIREHLTRREG